MASNASELCAREGVAMCPLQTNEAVLASLVQDSPVAVVVSRVADGRILDVNDRFLRLFAYSRDEVIGQTLAGLGLWTDPEEQARLTAVLLTGQPLRDLEVTVRTKSGAERQVLATVTEVELDGRTCRLSQMLDVTVHRHEQLQFRALVEQIPVITYAKALDEPLTLTYISPQVEAILGYSPTEVLAGQPNFLASRTHPEDSARVRAAAEQARRTSSPFSVEYRVQARDGRLVWLQDEAVLVRDLQGRPLLWQGVLVDITARKAVEDALRQSEERFRAVWDATSDAIALSDPDGIVLAVNPAYCALYGLSPEEVLGHKFSVIFPEEVREDAEAQYCAIFADSSPPRSYEAHVLRRDGAERFVEAQADFIIRNGQRTALVSVIRDVTEWRTAESARRESEERFRSSFDYAPIGMALVSLDGRFLQVNRTLCELVGYTEQELLGKSSQDITHPDDIADGLDLRQRLSAGDIDSYQLEKRYVHKDGHVVWVLLTESVVHNRGLPHYSITQILDIRERRHLEMDRAVMLASERDYSRQLRALTEMRADLTAMIAHELHAPVAALRMMAFLLSSGGLSPQDESEMFAAVKGEIAQLDRLINDMGAVTAAEREDFSVQLHPINLGVLLDGAEAYARMTMADHRFTAPPVPKVQVWCDPERISQVLRNLLDNAAKHTPTGTFVELRAHQVGKQVRLEVADCGPGLLAEDIDLVFEKFGRGHVAAALQTPGAGLGLYVSRQIIRAHGSDLTVESTPGTGTVFAFDLKVAS